MPDAPINYIALIPAAGLGSRLGKIPSSKELMEVGSKPVSAYLIAHFKRAGVTDIHFIIRKEKNDIPELFQSGDSRGVDISYHYTELNAGVPYTLDTAYGQCGKKNILFGFPDILFHPSNSFAKMIRKLEENRETDLLLGLFPVDNPEIWDTVEMDSSNNIKDVLIKEKSGKQHRYAWIIAVWRPTFFDFLHDQLQGFMSDHEGKGDEIYLGHIIRRAIKAGLRVKGLPFDNGVCLDVGTPNGLDQAEVFLKDLA